MPASPTPDTWAPAETPASPSYCRLSWLAAAFVCLVLLGTLMQKYHLVPERPAPHPIPILATNV